MAFRFPFGFNRADGVTNLPNNPLGIGGGTGPLGTPTPDDALIIQSPNGGDDYVLEEDIDSPEIERAEQCTAQHSATLSWSSALAYLVQMGRGTFVTDSFGNIWRILSTKIKSARGNKATISCSTESISFDSPPDDYQMIPVELGIDIIKYPRYFYSLYPSGSDYTDLVGVAPAQATRAQVKQAIIRAIQTYRDSPYFPPQSAIPTLNSVVQNAAIQFFLQSLIPCSVDSTTGTETTINVAGDKGCALAIAAANEIIQKLWNQLDTPYIAGRQITWTQYFFQPVYENPGGYIEDPTYIVPDYFMQPSVQNSLARGDLGNPWGNFDTLPPVNGTHGVGGATIFDLDAQINPQCYSSNGKPDGGVNISWLRKCDEVVFERTWFKVTKTWIGSPIGHWDAQIYQQGNRPEKPSDYLPLV